MTEKCTSQYLLTEGFVECEKERGHDGNHIFTWEDDK